MSPRETAGGSRWCVGYTLARKEALAETHLKRQGFETFLPRIAATRRHARKIRPVETSLFPRYLFVRINPRADRWRSINGTIGVAYLLTDGELPSPAPVGFVEALKQSVGDEGLLELGSALAPGDKVRIAAGPFANQIGELVRVDGRGRVEILLEIMNSAARVSVARKLLEPAA